MTIVTLRDNTRYHSLNDNILEEGINLISSLFGLESQNKGSWIAGRFVPGDLDNRLAYAQQWMSRLGLTNADISKAAVENIIYQPSGWQGGLDTYFQNVATDKTAHPEKYPANVPVLKPDGSVIQQPINPNQKQVGTNAGLGDMNFTTIALIGVGVYFLAQVLGGKKRRR